MEQFLSTLWGKEKLPVQTSHITQHNTDKSTPEHTNGNTPIHIANNNYITIGLTQEQIQQAKQENEVKSTASAYAQAKAAAQNTNFFSDMPGLTKQFFDAHTWQLIAVTIGATYGYICYRVIQGNIYLAQPNLWSSWKAALSLQHLCALPQEELTQALIFDLQNKYINPANPLDPHSSFTHFMYDIERERAYLEQLQTLHRKLKNTYMLHFFPLNTKRYASIPKRLDRIAFIQHLFSTWIAEHKVGPHAPLQVAIMP